MTLAALMVGKLSAKYVAFAKLAGGVSRPEALLRVLEPFGVSELVKSGLVAVGRGSRSISERSLRSVERPA